MPDRELRFHSTNGKRLILVVEDEFINREILGMMLQDTYQVAFASTGEEALSLIAENRETLSLVLLDLILPDMNGMDILRHMRDEGYISRIPVIVMTSDTESEVDSLTLGASDFIPKPYPQPKVVLARVKRTIELSEDRDIIRSTQRDALTELYNREYFYRYAEQYDTYHRDQQMDAVVVDINHFHVINERYGRAFGDEVLIFIAERLREAYAPDGGIICRREGDTFLVYCPHRTDHDSVMDDISSSLAAGGKSVVRLRMGVYSQVEKSLDIERRFDRAKMAADTVRGSYARTVAYYDSALHEEEMYAEQLLDDFPAAVREKQFAVYYQPKFDISVPEPRLSSAEALVRWIHPELGMISPGIFIPLFEKNGLIRDLDRYVWRQTASDISDWKKRLGFTVPVSVNVSRIDMLDPDLPEHISSLADEFGIKRSELYLEITESAYTQDAEQIITAVNRLREKGFFIEMDDFGSGYSSLNMLSTLPIDALKLDMQFLRNALGSGKNTRMLEVVFDIADSLGVPTIAEGVETAEQMFALRAMGCDIAQGYLFSKPLPKAEYEPFLSERKDAPDAPSSPGHSALKQSVSRINRDRFLYEAVHDPLTGMFNLEGFRLLFGHADRDHLAVIVIRIDTAAAPGFTHDEAVLTVAGVLRKSFRSVDLVCRTGEDEFVVVMTRVTPEIVDSVIEGKISAVSSEISPVTMKYSTVYTDDYSGPDLLDIAHGILGTDAGDGSLGKTE